MAGEFLSPRIHVREPRDVMSGKQVSQLPDVALMDQNKIAPIFIGTKTDEKRISGVKAGVIRLLTEPGISFTPSELAEKITGKTDDASLETTCSIVTGLNEDLEKQPYHIISNTAPDGVERMSIAPKETIVFSAEGITELHPPTTGKRTKAMREVEKAHGLPGETIRDILQRLYWGNDIDPTKRSMQTVAYALDCSIISVRQWMNIHGIKIRTRQESVNARWEKYNAQMRTINEGISVLAENDNISAEIGRKVIPKIDVSERAIPLNVRGSNKHQTRVILYVASGLAYDGNHSDLLVANEATQPEKGVFSSTEEIGKFLLKKRLELDIEKVQFARRVGAHSRWQITRMENGRDLPNDPSMILLIALELRLKPEETEALFKAYIREMQKKGHFRNVPKLN